jgi:hypothetical protein
MIKVKVNYFTAIYMTKQWQEFLFTGITHYNINNDQLYSAVSNNVIQDFQMCCSKYKPF